MHESHEALQKCLAEEVEGQLSFGGPLEKSENEDIGFIYSLPKERSLQLVHLQSPVYSCTALGVFGFFHGAPCDFISTQVVKRRERIRHRAMAYARRIQFIPWICCLGAFCSRQQHLFSPMVMPS
ncbi:hypothetical protein AAC387_Pa04g1056 [Persea americana]